MKADELFPVAIETRILITILFKALRRDLEQRLEARGLNVGALPYGVMRQLSHRSYTISELSRRMNLSAATLVPVVDMLERNGLAKRGQDPCDRRRTPLILTPDGVESLARVPIFDGEDALAKALSAMPDEQCCTLLRLLRELVGKMVEGDEVVQEVSAMAQKLSARAAPMEETSEDCDILTSI